MDCKSLYWTPERRNESKIEKQQQQICTSLNELVDQGKTEMSWEDFTFKGLSLKLANQIYTSVDDKIVALFTEGQILIDPKTLKIKIVI
jgi:predicted naringenin-chalcone synthase